MSTNNDAHLVITNTDTGATAEHSGTVHACPICSPPKKAETPKPPK